VSDWSRVAMAMTMSMSMPMSMPMRMTVRMAMIVIVARLARSRADTGFLLELFYASSMDSSGICSSGLYAGMREQLQYGLQVLFGSLR
jgi:hypothetical protein